MSAPYYNIELNQGADYNLSLLFNDSSEVPLPLADASFEAQIRSNYDTKIILGKFVCTKDADIEGHLTLSMSADQTAVLDFDSAYYDLLMTQNGVKTRMIQGSVSLSKSITK